MINFHTACPHLCGPFIHGFGLVASLSAFGVERRASAGEATPKQAWDATKQDL